ncbi:MAG: NFACT family protein [Armatimonadota bacterium]
MMTYDGLVLAAVVAELKKSIQGGPIQNIRQHNDTDITLDIRNNGKSHLLFMSVDAKFARIHTTATNLLVPKSALNFCMLLRKYLKGAFVTSVEQAGFDRVVKIRTEAPDGNRNTLILELMGRHSNLILVSDSERILGAAKNITASVSRYRQVLPGLEYMPPPGGTKADPVTLTREEFESLRRDGLGESPSVDEMKRWLVAAFSGIGPFLAEEIMLRSGDNPTPDSVRDALQGLRQTVTESDYSPRLITDGRGAAVYAYPIPVKQLPAANQHERLSINETLDTLYRDLIKRNDYDTVYSSLETAIRRSIAWREQMLKDAEKALLEGEKAERYKQFGELVLASIATIEKGQNRAQVTDYYDQEMPVIDIPLDEKLTPKENAERYFRRYRKAAEGADAAIDRQKELGTEIKILKTAVEKLPSAASADALKALRTMLVERGLLRAEPQQEKAGKRGAPEFGTAKIRKFMSVDGLEVLYGENSLSNDYLTTKVARPNDLWFHARSVRGAHVVVRTANKPDRVPPATLRQAAEVAAKNSDARHSSLVPVDYTLRKFVRKPRAAAPGYVIYEREKTVDVTP